MLSLTNILDKPKDCLSCSYSFVGQGFAPDHYPSNPKIAFLDEYPGETDMMQREPLVGATGRMFFHSMLEGVGLCREDILIASVLRCRPPEGAYPIAQLKKDAEKLCRKYDGYHQSKYENHVELVAGGLNSYNPTRVMVTVHPSFVSRTWSMLRVAQKDMEKALRLSEGHRLLVLLGDIPMKLVLPDLDGGVLKWRGHYQDIDWNKFRKGFESAKTQFEY